MPEAPNQPDALEIHFEDAPADSDTCIVRVNRPVAAGEPQYFSSPEEAASQPLARTLLELGCLEALLLQDRSITLLKPLEGESWESVMSRAQPLIQSYFEELDARVGEPMREMTPEEHALMGRVQEVMDAEINPYVASHGGFIQVLAVRDATLFVHMGGGCQGCAMSTATLKQGVESAVFKHFPELQAVLDTTDHAAGTNPYYQQ